MSFATLTAGQAILGASALSAGGDILSGILGSSAANTAAQQAVSGQEAALTAQTGALQNALTALGPYAQGGTTNYDLLNYLMTGQMPSVPNAQSLLSQIGSITGGGAPANLASGINTLQSWISEYPGWEAQHPNAANEGGTSNYAQAESLLGQLEQIQNQQGAANAANAAIGQLPNNLGAGSLLSMLSTPFSYNPLTDPNLQNAANFATQELASQNAAAGSYGSGTMAANIANYLAGSLEPTYYNQALQNYQTNYPGMAGNIMSALEGNLGGAGQNVATDLGNLFTGSGNQIANLATGIGNSLASGTMASSNALTNMLTNSGNALQTGAGQYLNAGLLNQILANQNAGGGGNIYDLNDLNSYNPANNPYDPMQQQIAYGNGAAFGSWGPSGMLGSSTFQMPTPPSTYWDLV